MQIKEADASEHLNEASSPLLAILSPLKKADDAIYIDTTDMSIEEVVDRLFKEINNMK